MTDPVFCDWFTMYAQLIVIQQRVIASSTYFFKLEPLLKTKHNFNIANRIIVNPSSPLVPGGKRTTRSMTFLTLYMSNVPNAEVPNVNISAML